MNKLNTSDWRIPKLDVQTISLSVECRHDMTLVFVCGIGTNVIFSHMVGEVDTVEAIAFVLAFCAPSLISLACCAIVCTRFELGDDVVFGLLWDSSTAVVLVN